MAIEVVCFYGKLPLNLYMIQKKYRNEIPQWQFYHFLVPVDCRPMEVAIGSLEGVSNQVFLPYIQRIGFSKGFNSGRHIIQNSENNELRLRSPYSEILHNS